MTEHLECVVKLSNGKLDWYDPVYEVEVLGTGELFITTALYEYILKSDEWVDYKVRPYHLEYTFYWEDQPE